MRRFLVALATLVLGVIASATATAQVPLAGPANSGFGSAIHAWQNLIVVGAPLGAGAHGAAQGGRAFLYTKATTGGSYTVTELDPSASLQAQSGFGTSVIVTYNGYAFVGAPGFGIVYIFGNGTGSPGSWGTFTKIEGPEAGFGQAIDFDLESGLIVICAHTNCYFYSQQGMNWQPAQTSGMYWPGVVGARGKFVWNGQWSDLVTSSGKLLETGTVNFYQPHFRSFDPVGYHFNSNFSFNGGPIGQFGTHSGWYLPADVGSHLLVTGPTPGLVQSFEAPRTEGVPGTPPFLQLPSFNLIGLGAGARIGTGIVLEGNTAFIANPFSLTNSQVLSYVLDNKGTLDTSADDVWNLDTSANYGIGGPSYGAALAWSTSHFVVGDPGTNSITPFTGLTSLVSTKTCVPTQCTPTGGSQTCPSVPCVSGSNDQIVIVTKQTAGSGLIKAEVDKDCGAFETTDPVTGATRSLIAGNDQPCVHVDKQSAVLVGLQEVCFPPTSGTDASFGRCHETTLTTCGLDAQGRKQFFNPIGGKNYCCSPLATTSDNINAPGLTCALSDGFSDFAHATFVDSDNDLIRDIFDNCRTFPNLTQTDTDKDGVGDACDNCLTAPNQSQADWDSDGIGNECDPTPGVAPTALTPTPAPAAAFPWLLLLGGGLGLLGVSRLVAAAKEAA